MLQEEKEKNLQIKSTKEEEDSEDAEERLQRSGNYANCREPIEEPTSDAPSSVGPIMYCLLVLVR